MRHDASKAVTMLRNGAADITLGRPGDMDTPWPADIHGRAVLPEPIQLLVPDGHELEGTTRITPVDLAAHPLWFPTAGAPTEWTDLLTELARTFDLIVDQAGSTFGFDHWLEQVADGSAPPSLVGAGMQLPPGLPISTVPIVNPTPVFYWWAMWRRRLPANLVTQFLAALDAALTDIELEDVTSLWMPQRDRQISDELEKAPRPHPRR